MTETVTARLWAIHPVNTGVSLSAALSTLPIDARSVTAFPLGACQAISERTQSSQCGIHWQYGDMETPEEPSAKFYMPQDWHD